MLTMNKWLLLGATIFIFLALYCKSVLPIGQPQLGHSTIPDTDGDLLVSLSIAQNKYLYEDFSILYPPGRFFLQAFALRVSNFSFPVIGSLHIAANILIFPIVLFVFTFWFMRAVLERDHLPISKEWYIDTVAYVLALTSTALYLGMIHSAQEVHSLLGIFFILMLLPSRNIRGQVLAAGFLYGLILLFRTDAWIILSLALAVTILSQKKNWQELQKWLLPFIQGFLIVWVPAIVILLIHGSVQNFLYDTVVLGLMVQPHFMSLPLPLNDVKLIFWAVIIFLIGTGSALFIDAQTSQPKSGESLLKQIGLQSFTVTAVLSYVSALGRSDEPHLWYDLVWLTPLIVYTVYQLILFFYKLLPQLKFVSTSIIWAYSKNIFISIVIICGLIFFGHIILKLKSPIIFLLSSCAVIYALYYVSIKPTILLISGTVGALLVFHSISYLNLRWYFPLPPLAKPIEFSWLTHQTGEFYGLEILPETKSQLQLIRKVIPAEEKYLFVFPKNILLTEELGMQRPTRYIILMNERTPYTEQEVISDLQQTNTQYFLIFPEEAKQRGDLVWEWILENTTITHEFIFGEDVAQLRQRNTK